MLKKVHRAVATHMTKFTTTVSKNGGNGKANTTEEKAVVAAGIAVITAKHEEKQPLLKVENLQLVIEKRAKLVQTYSELERFQISSNDFNCSMRLNAFFYGRKSINVMYENQKSFHVYLHFRSSKNQQSCVIHFVIKK